MSETNRYWIDGRRVAEHEAVIPITDHGLLYGDGVFEGIRFYHRRAFRLSAHLRRLSDSARAIGLELPYSADALSQAIEDLVEDFPDDDGYLRLIVTRGSGPMGLDPGACHQPRTLLIATRLEMVHPELRQDGIALVVAATRRLPADGLDPRIKGLNYLNHILARMEATRAGAQEAVLLNAQGRVAEGSAENIFIARDGRLSTPRPADGALAGITRGIVLDLASGLGIPTIEEALTPYDLHTADECFLSGTGAELIPVREIDGRRIARCPGPIFSSLRDAFHTLVERETLS